MAKGDVILRFDATTAAAVQQILAARRAVEQAADASRKFGDDAARAGDKAQAGFDKAGKSAESMSSKLTSVAQSMLPIASAGAVVTAAIKMATDTGERYFAMMEERAKKLIAEVSQLNASMSGAGQAPLIASVRKHIDSLHQVGGMEVNKSEAETMFRGIASATGNKLGADTEKEERTALNTALLGRASQMSVEQSTQLGTMYAQLARQRQLGGFEGATDEHLQDLAFQISSNMPGGLSDKQMRFLSHSQNKGAAVQLLVAASESNESARALQRVEDLADAEIDPAKIRELEKKSRNPRKFTAEDRAALELSKLAPGAERFDAIWNDPSLAGKDAASIENLQRGMMHAPALMSLKKYVADYAVGADPETRASMAAQALDAQSSNIDRNNSLNTAQRLNRAKAIDNTLKRDHDVVYSVPGAASAAAFGNEHPWAGGAVSALPVLGPAAASLFGLGPGALNSSPTPAGAPRTDGGNELQHKQLIGVLHEQNQLIRQQTSTIERQRNPMLSNNSEGQK